MATPHGLPLRPTTRRGFEIATICALPLEADAVDALFDVHWDDHDDNGPPFGKVMGDPNAYSTGAIGRHNVVLAHMPGMGKANAAAVAANCQASFPNIKLALVVGVCGVVPFGRDGEEIVLGDVIISDGVIQYDLGRRLPDHFVRKDTLQDTLGRPNLEIRGLLAKLKEIRYRRLLVSKMTSYLDILRKEPLLQSEYPGSVNDKLFKATYRHMEDQQSCEQLGCDGKLVPRTRLNITQGSPQPAVHFGLIASGDSVMKSGEDRDAIAKAEGVIAFEMEGTGVWDSFPCVVIKSACDYSDSHKSKVWQRYAAATAAACMKAFLSHWVSSFLPGVEEGESSSIKRRPVHYIPFPENMDFVRRTGVLDTLKDMLFAQTSARRVALVGLGGMGKTQVALHLAHWVKRHHPEHSVFWIPAFSMASFEQACTELVKKLNIQCTDEEEDAKELVRQHLSSQDLGSWLLIVDNADDIEILDGLAQRPNGILDSLPQSDNGRILFTTRIQEVAVAATTNKVVRLSEMSRQEATSFLEKSLLQKDQLQNNGVVADLLEKLTYFPLAIAQAAAYMNMNQASVEEYMRLLRLTDQDMIELLRRRFRDGTHYHSSQGAVATTWTISFEQIRRTDSLAANLLSFVAFIEPKAIPRSLFPKPETEQQMTQAIGMLLGYGFLTRRGDDQLFDMHSLVHLATRIQSEDQGTADRIQRDVLAHLTEVFPTDQWENRESWQQYLPHALRAIEIRKGVDNGVCELELWVGRCLLVDGRTQEAINLLEHVVGIQKKTLVETDLSRLNSQHSLARAYRADRRVKDAISLQEYVVKIYTEILPEDHSDRLTSQHTLAGAYQADGQIKAAVELMENVVGIRKRVLVEGHPDRLASQHALALTYRAYGQVKEAIELLEHVVGIYTKTLVEDHPFRLASQHELAGAYQANGQMNKAVELLEHVARMREKVLAEDHSSRLASQQELAGAYQASGQVKEAIELLQHVVRIREKVLVEDHHSRLVSQQKLAGAYQSNGQVTKAIKLLEHVVRIRESELAEDHPARLTSQEELAAAYQANGQVKEAAELLGYVTMIQEGASTQETWLDALSAYLSQPDELDHLAVGRGRKEMVSDSLIGTVGI
ncbi:hypothetical protein EDB80DRAFT_887773 [Ilyonectria destructans]|nr:hypothetical protein EDB80DRAFT_887773 [Ilyonectria destructans]